MRGEWGEEENRFSLHHAARWADPDLAERLRDFLWAAYLEKVRSEGVRAGRIYVQLWHTLVRNFFSWGDEEKLGQVVYGGEIFHVRQVGDVSRRILQDFLEERTGDVREVPADEAGPTTLAARLDAIERKLDAILAILEPGGEDE